MSVLFSSAPKINPQKRNQPPKYYAIAQSNGEVNFRQLAKEIAEITTVSVPDAVAVLESLVMIIPRHIENGEIVRLGELGSLRITINSEGSGTEEEVNASKIKKANYRFSPGSELQQTLKILKYSKVKKVPAAEPTAAKYSTHFITLIHQNRRTTSVGFFVLLPKLAPKKSPNDAENFFFAPYLFLQRYGELF